MKKTTLETLGDVFHVLHYGSYVVFVGKHLWIFRDNGEFVAHRKDIVNPAHTVYLPEDRLFLECGKQKAYILLSLETGDVIHRIPMPKYDLMRCGFILSPDERYIYGIYDCKDTSYFLQISTHDWALTMFPLQQGFSAIHDLICDKNGIPCILESRYQMIDDNHVGESGVRYVWPDDINPGSAYYWKSKWTLPFPHASHRFVLNAETVLTNHLWLYNVSDGTTINLLENETHWQLPRESLGDACFTNDGRFIILYYLRSNVVLDVQARKVVAEYAAACKMGFLIGNKFWLPSDIGVDQKNFPAFEEIPPLENRFWGSVVN